MASVWAEQPGVELAVKVVRVAGVEARPEGGGGGGLFVRYYVPAGDGKRRIRVDTREVPCGDDGEEDGEFWGELARFERRGGGGVPASVGGIVFELRWRPRRRSPAFLGRPSSRLLARGELACQDDVAVTPAPASSGSTWLRLSPACRELSGFKAPKLLVEVRMIHAAVGTVSAADNYGAVKATRSFGSVNYQHCCRDGERCGQCGWIGTEEDMFLAATFNHE
uniref:Uncharacterized protein n=1 Tax=Oryza punctata TaxID=4537 RepID=A0A0E0KRC5_ORYPU